jgi:hypothetical protein
MTMSAMTPLPSYFNPESIGLSQFNPGVPTNPVLVLGWKPGVLIARAFRAMGRKPGINILLVWHRHWDSRDVPVWRVTGLRRS